jgi:hypothetical protein
MGKVRSTRALALVPFLLASVTACGDDDGPANGYYLRGRVFNGATLAAVAKAELSLINGEGTAQATSAEDGTFSIGPIEPSSSWRVAAKANGMQDFEFTGVALAALDPMLGDQTRTLIADVPLYAASKQSPAFKLLVESSDARLPASIASINFAPATVGTDPSKAADPLPAQVGLVSGAFAEPRGATMPNDARGSATAFHTTLSNGEAEIPEGALTWGATYNVRVDAGPDFSTVSFLLTPVKENDISIVIPTTAKYPTQLPQTTQQYFTGRIYDGVSLERLSSYRLRIEYFDRAMDATVGADGRFVVGPLLANADYTISVEKDGFRSFLSHNAKVNAASISTVSSLYYDAFLYPTSVRTPAAQARFALQGDTAPPSGTVRFAPISSSSLEQKPAAVGAQVWTNDEDLQQRAIVRDFTDGKLDMNEGEFVLGVDYQVTVYGVGTYAILNGGTFRAGVDGNPSFTLAPRTETALEVLAISTEGAALSPSGSIEIRFNHDIVAYPKMDANVALKSLNDGFSIDSPDENEDMNLNVLVDSADLTPPIAPTYRGVTWEIAGDSLTLKWNREAGLADVDTADPIISVTYDNLDAIQLYSGTNTTSPMSTLADLLNTTSITAQMVAQ